LKQNILLCEQQTRRKKTTMAYITKPEHDKINFVSPNQINCVPQETSIRDVRLAAGYVPYQKFCTTFSPLESLMKGTAFPELYSPFEGNDRKLPYLIGCKREEEI
jgi:hypothetical protein